MNEDYLRNTVKVWQQDGAVPRSHEDYESPMKAYRRLSGTEDHDLPLKKDDLGDPFVYHMSDGWVVVETGDLNGRVYKPVVPVSTLCHDNVFAFGVTNTFWYTNHRGEKGWRRAVPLHLVWDRHSRVCPESKDETDQWLLVCFDLDKNAIRHFALKDIEPR